MNKKIIISSYLKIRKKTETLIKDLKHEEMVVQTESFVSPIKWHLAHTTWFFENFVIKKFKRITKLMTKILIIYLTLITIVLEGLMRNLKEVFLYGL